jgi:hypothetical protein
MRRLVLVALVLAGCPRPEARPPTGDAVSSWVVISSTRPSGTYKTTTAADGTITANLFVLENGRGPATDAVVRLADDGTIASLHATGHHEMGTKVDETFTLEGGHAAWSSTEERGEADVRAPTCFVPMAA